MSDTQKHIAIMELAETITLLRAELNSTSQERDQLKQLLEEHQHQHAAEEARDET